MARSVLLEQEKKRNPKKEISEIDLSKNWKSDFSFSHHRSSEVHFCHNKGSADRDGDAGTTDQCARGLISFMTPETHLDVHGHADTLGIKKKTKKGEDFNTDLSRRRAANTVKAIKDILGPKFRINQKNIHEKPWEDKVAAKQYSGKPVASPIHRRVQIVINSVLVLTLFGQDPSMNHQFFMEHSDSGVTNGSINLDPLPEMLESGIVRSRRIC